MYVELVIVMKTFKYNFLARIIYRYALIPLNFILLIYLMVSIIAVFEDWKFVFPILINIILLYVLNRFYIKVYKNFPFKIDIDNEKMICSDFVINNRVVQIQHSDITKITGGIFSGRSFSPLYIESDNTRLGISPHMKDFNKLLTIILTNIPKELYQSLLESIKKVAFDNTPKNKKKNSNK